MATRRRAPFMSDDERLHSLYRTYGPALYARCRQILGDTAAAADVAQETFLRLHRQLDRAADQRQALAWIYRVATNHCLNVARDRRRRAEPVGELPEVPGQDMERLLEDGNYPAIATHDPALILATRGFALRMGIAKSRWEFQMLYGVRRDAQTALAADGYGMRIYVPFGTDWYPYFTRRIAERPTNALFVLRQLVSR